MRSGTSTDGVEQLEQLLEAGAGALHRVEQLAQLLHGVEEVAQRQHEEGDGADGDDVLDRHPAADADDQRGGAQPGELDDRQVPGLARTERMWAS